MKQHLPLVALVGRPNVGKSTLFNRLIKKRVSITHDMAGVTRDSIYSEVRGETRSYALVDTGGLVPGSSDEIEMNIVDQAREAMAGADLILFVVDGRTGLHPQDDQVGRFLRQSGKEVRVVVNKVDGLDEHVALAEFAALGIAALLLVATVWISLRAPRRVLRVLLPMALTTLLILAVLRGIGVELTLFHLVSLILAAGLGLDYALFFDHAGDDRDDQLRTLHAVLVCSLMTLLVFSLLALSSIPVLRAIGSTVALGVLLNFVLSLLIARAPAASPGSKDRSGAGNPADPFPRLRGKVPKADEGAPQAHA